MAMEADQIVNMIKDGLPGADVQITDLRGDGDHYAVTVTSAAFEGLSRVQQHQKVYDALQGRMGTALHALSVTTKLPTDTQKQA
jgi:stress-induced morphogen